MNTKSITGIVLAGGRSSRMGSDKSLMELKDKSLVEYAIDALKPLCSKVVISSNNSVYGFTGCEVWPDELPDGAPMIGIYSCLKRSETEINIILSCDMPLMSTAMLEYLLANSENYDITVPVHSDGFIEPLCGIYKQSSIEILKEFIDRSNFRLNQCIQAASSQLVPVGPQLSFFSSSLFSNINTPDDYRNLQSFQQPVT
ncbi:MAG: molybdenum cofactor guanylyltransferase [Bacteroidota bacterium]|nr:molybdenum cofactor guanylyltransferase [Bacteroidota bacterium]